MDCKMPKKNLQTHVRIYCTRSNLRKIRSFSKLQPEHKIGKLTTSFSSPTMSGRVPLKKIHPVAHNGYLHFSLQSPLLRYLFSQFFFFEANYSPSFLCMITMPVLTQLCESVIFKPELELHFVPRAATT